MSDSRAIGRVGRWKRLAPLVHQWAGLDAAGRAAALGAARMHPTYALRCYEAISASLMPPENHLTTQYKMESP